MPRNDNAVEESTGPTSVGNYILDKTIGKGSYGKVKLGYHKETNEKFAVKIIEKSKLKSQKQVSRLQREIRFLKLLHHPHIIKVHDVIETNDYIYIVMENANGGELFDYIVAHKRVKENEARSFFRQVLSAVHYCHLNAVIHRDLKPENLLLDDKKSIKIIDFGFGNNFTGDGKLLDTFCGSPFYAAPEMILGKKYEGPEVDMWSLGVILFALLCGHLPFDDEDIQKLYKKIAAGQYTSPDYLMPNARHLIGRLITVDPKTRATLSEVMHHPWVMETYTDIPPFYLPVRPVITDTSLLSKDIIRRLYAFGYTDDSISKAFCKTADFTRPNPVRATYFLLVEMLAREEVKALKVAQVKLTHLSIADPKTGEDGPESAPAALEKEKMRLGNIKEKNTFISLQDITAVKEVVRKDSRKKNDAEKVSTIMPPQQKIEVYPVASQPVRRQSMPIITNIPPRRPSITATTTRIKEEIRSVSGWFLNMSTTSTKDPELITTEVKRALVELGVSFKSGDEAMSFVCEVDINKVMRYKEVSEDVLKEDEEEMGPDDKGPSVLFGVEICAVPKMKGVYGLHFKRLQGGVWNYKKICNRMLGTMKL